MYYLRSFVGQSCQISFFSSFSSFYPSSVCCHKNRLKRSSPPTQKSAAVRPPQQPIRLPLFLFLSSFSPGLILSVLRSICPSRRAAPSPKLFCCDRLILVRLKQGGKTAQSENKRKNRERGICTHSLLAQLSLAPVAARRRGTEMERGLNESFFCPVWASELCRLVKTPPLFSLPPTQRS